MELDHVGQARGDLPEEYEPHFQGRARIQRFASPFGAGPAVSAVHFDAGGRTRPPRPPLGTGPGRRRRGGIVADRSGRRTIRSGDVVTVEPGEWHWHGGTPTTAMTHLTVQEAGDVDWDVDEGDWASDY